HFRLN
ncbi:unnamed protein product, partial [Parascedosporium putredinis]